MHVSKKKKEWLYKNNKIFLKYFKIKINLHFLTTACVMHLHCKFTLCYTMRSNNPFYSAMILLFKVLLCMVWVHGPTGNAYFEGASTPPV